ncbi:enoyl-CoA hydratase/isomerase family protein [Pendulispora albinea]|uniref:Enoyl-CoA hydratase-related protein n=1 Tax=Pendulispora albinea TaxID=2741071 RepID=A0ABZ2LLZ8_9BACT
MTTATEYDTMIEGFRAAGAGLVRVSYPFEGCAVVSMHDPARLNALSGPLTVRLRDELERAIANPAVRAIVLTGEGGAFSAGGDLRLMRDTAWPLLATHDGTTALWRWIRTQFGGIVRLIAQSDKPFIAAVDGPAAGVGLSFALACDLVLVSTRARLVSAFGRIGLVPEVGISWLLTRRLGHARAFELFVSGEPLSGEDAVRLGLANAAHAPEALEEAAFGWVRKILALPEHAVRMTKPLLRGAADMAWPHAILAEEFAEPNCFTTAAHREVVSAMLEKRSGSRT